MSQVMPGSKSVEYAFDTPEAREDLKGVAWFCPHDQARNDETRFASFPLATPVVGKYIVLRISPDPTMSATQQMQIKYIRFNGTLLPPSDPRTSSEQPVAAASANRMALSLTLRSTNSEFRRSPGNSASSNNKNSSASSNSDEDDLMVRVLLIASMDLLHACSHGTRGNQQAGELSIPQLFDIYDLLRYAISRKGKYLAILIRVARHCPLLSTFLNVHLTQWYRCCTMTERAGVWY